MQDPDAGVAMTTCKVENIDYENCFAGSYFFVLFFF